MRVDTPLRFYFWLPLRGTGLATLKAAVQALRPSSLPYLIERAQPNPYKSQASCLIQPPHLTFYYHHHLLLMSRSPSVNPPSLASQKLCSMLSKAADGEQNTAPPPATSNVSKEVRAYEHHRRRVKKTAETANLRVRKLASATKQLSLSQPRTSTNKVRKGAGVFDDLLDLDIPAIFDAAQGDEQPDLRRGKAEVSLADFVVARKNRKGADNDFEVIPHVRSVIILDDDQLHDIEIDEPWEYINGIDDDQVCSDVGKPISYAMVAAQAKF
ncbi:hypothetical protein AX15_000633 [Amanita polypyramis BW_CC]|nr:hypothetical protein AX15_000633 [Amanita polypyramis BW_CC]